MILIGQYDSPFVRRVGIALHLHGAAFEHRPWSTFGDAERLRAVNPLCRVPTLLLDDGTMLPDSASILDHLDEQAGPDALVAPCGPARLQARRRCALALGVCEKAVALVYERILHEVTSAAWVARCTAQIEATLDRLEAEPTTAAPFWFGRTPGHDDIALACAIAFLAAAHPGLLAGLRIPALLAHARRCEALPAFAAIRQDFVPPR